MPDFLSYRYFATPFSYRVQKTIKSTIRFSGVGLHSGAKTQLTISPAPPNVGLVFQRTDRSKVPAVRAHYDNVVATSMATTLGINGQEQSHVGTVEHLLAALFAMGITNCHIQVSGPEIPILDGSAFAFAQAFYETGVEVQPFSTPILKIHNPVRMTDKNANCELLPRDCLRLTTSIDFAHPSIGKQTYAVELTPQIFLEEICQARTFGFEKELQTLNQHGLALGASIENVLAFTENGVLNKDGKRFPDECVRHKLLDAIGDMALCGCWIEGELVSLRGGHSIHYAMLQELGRNQEKWEILPSETLKVRPFLGEPLFIDPLETSQQQPPSSQST